MKRILSIDGGGIRGIIPAMVLAHIEKKKGKPIAAMFDLISGTSTGGILALGLTIPGPGGKPKFSADQLVGLYEKRGKDIFKRSWWHTAVSVSALFDEKYSAKGLEEVLTEYLEDEIFGACLTRLLITSYDIQNRTPCFFKSWRDIFKNVEMRHVARAASAAPTYFEPALVPMDAGTRALIDGGVFINNPGVSAFAEAKKIYGEGENFFILSLGTGKLERPISYEEAKDWGKIEWVGPLLNCMFDGVSDAVDYQLDQILSGDYIRLQADLSRGSDDMDDVTNSNIQCLKANASSLIKRQGKPGGLLDKAIQALP